MSRRGSSADSKHRVSGIQTALNLPVAGILHNPKSEWRHIASRGSTLRTARSIDVDWKKYPLEKFLFTHATICCSVDVESDGHTIKPACSELVNDNGNAWTNPVMLATFRSFIGAENYLEHCFTEDVRVNMADGTMKQISQCWRGDLVLDRNGIPRKIENLQIRFSDTLYLIDSPAMGKPVKSTGNHPFWVYDGKGFDWKKAEDLDPEKDKLVVPPGLAPDGSIPVAMSPWRVAPFSVTKMDVLEKRISVYNLEVESDHTYCVENMVVHNCQIPALSKGKIIDAIIRPVKHISISGETADIFYVDILVATNRKHHMLVDSIEDGKLSTLSMGCSIAGTPVVMSDGTTVPVEEVKVGDNVITHTGGIAEVESTRVRETVQGELHRLGISGLSDTYVTGEHPYWVLKGNDVCIGCGKEMPDKQGKPWTLDQILNKWCSSSCRQSHVNSNPKCKKDFTPFEQRPKFDWVNVADIKVGDYVSIPLGRPEAKRDSLQVERARLLGLYAAEGNLQRDINGNIRSVEFSLHKDEPIGDEIIRMAQSLGISDDRIYSQIRIRESGESRRVVIHDRDIAEWLFETCGEHCDGKVLAPWILGLDDESILHVLGAYMDGDGHCRPDSARFSTTSCSKKLSEQVLMMLLSVGVPASISSEKKVRGKKPFWSVTTRKGGASQLKGYSVKFRTQIANKSKVSNVGGYMLRRVTANEPQDTIVNVYNIHVQNESQDHSYIMNGVAVHNCNANEVQCSKCGKVFHEGQISCSHITRELLTTYVDSNGVERIVSELCGYSKFDKKNGIWVGVPGSVEFIEASWVENPAFKGAVLNHFVSEIDREARKVLELSSTQLQDVIDNIFRVRVADKNGMMILRVAMAEMQRRKWEHITDRVAYGAARR